MPRERTKGHRESREQSEFDQRILDLSRVTRVTAGGKRLRFRVCLVVGDHASRVGIGVAKGADVSMAISKAANVAKKQMMNVTTRKGTIPHSAWGTFGAASVLLKPAPDGTGIIAGGVVRAVLEFGGVKNVVAKILGSKNKINNARAVMGALLQMRKGDPLPVKAKREQKQTEQQ